MFIIHRFVSSFLLNACFGLITPLIDPMVLMRLEMHLNYEP